MRARSRFVKPDKFLFAAAPERRKVVDFESDLAVVSLDSPEILHTHPDPARVRLLVSANVVLDVFQMPLAFRSAHLLLVLC